MFLSQGLQHFLVTDSPADLMPAPPVESRFVAVDSGHFCLLPLGLINPKKPGAIERLKFRAYCVAVRGTLDGKLPAHPQIGRPVYSFRAAPVVGLGENSGDPRV